MSSLRRTVDHPMTIIRFALQPRPLLRRRRPALVRLWNWLMEPIER
jgi:hypothetical protein